MGRRDDGGVRLEVWLCCCIGVRLPQGLGAATGKAEGQRRCLKGQEGYRMVSHVSPVLAGGSGRDGVGCSRSLLVSQLAAIKRPGRGGRLDVGRRRLRRGRGWGAGGGRGLRGSRSVLHACLRFRGIPVRVTGLAALLHLLRRREVLVGDVETTFWRW